MRQMLLVAGVVLAATVEPAAAQPPAADPGFLRSGDMLLFREGLNLPARAPGGVAHDRGAHRLGRLRRQPVAGPDGAGRSSRATSAEPHRQSFWESCAAWMPQTGVRCVERSDERTWLVVTERGPSCSATVGAPLRGTGLFNFGDPSCWSRLAVTHDIGHVFGLIHEHQRPDRDTYIEVRTENILPEFVYAYDRFATGRALGEYDFDSLMHYPPSGLQRATASPPSSRVAGYRDRARAMGLTEVPSLLDIEAVVQLYNATPRAPSGTPPPRCRSPGAISSRRWRTSTAPTWSNSARRAVFQSAAGPTSPASPPGSSTSISPAGPAATRWGRAPTTCAQRSARATSGGCATRT